MSYNSNYARKYCEEALKELVTEKKIKSKEVAKNTTVFYLVFDKPYIKQDIIKKVGDIII